MSPNIGPGGRLGKSMFGIPMVPRVVSGGCGEVTATRTIRYSRIIWFYIIGILMTCLAAYNTYKCYKLPNHLIGKDKGTEEQKA